jgi:hypothetical protein
VITVVVVRGELDLPGVAFGRYHPRMRRTAVVVAGSVLLAGFVGAAACSSFGSGTDGMPAADAGASSDSAVGARAIHCNGKLCEGSDICCVTVVGGNTTGARCGPASACAARPLACDNADECPPGDYCCVTTGGGSSEWSPSSCLHTPCAFPDHQLCATNAECGPGFEAGCTAAPSFVRPSGLSYCK